MKLPRDLSGNDLVQVLKKMGYRITRQTGSHIRISTSEKGEHHVTIPNHDALRVGTLASILGEIANHFELDRDEILKTLFGKC